MKTVSRWVLPMALGVALWGLSVAGSLASPPPHVTGGQAFFVTEPGDTAGPQQATTHVDQAVEVHLKVNLSDGTVKDVSEDELTSYSSGGHGSFNGEEYTPGAAEANKAFPLYAYYHDPSSGQTWTFTVHLVVRP